MRGRRPLSQLLITKQAQQHLQQLLLPNVEDIAYLIWKQVRFSSEHDGEYNGKSEYRRKRHALELTANLAPESGTLSEVTLLWPGVKLFIYGKQKSVCMHNYT